MRTNFPTAGGMEEKNAFLPLKSRFFAQNFQNFLENFSEGGNLPFLVQDCPPPHAHIPVLMYEFLANPTNIVATIGEA